MNLQYNLFNEIVKIIFSFGFLWAILLSVSAISGKNEDKEISGTFSALLLVKSLSLVFMWIFYYNVNIRNPLIAAFIFTVPAAIGPLYFKYYGLTFNFSEKWNWKYMFHFSPLPLLLTVLTMVFLDGKIMAIYSGGIQELSIL